MYYVVYENSNERKISSPQKSVDDCVKWANNAAEVDRKRGINYHYSIVKYETGISFKSDTRQAFILK